MRPSTGRCRRTPRSTCRTGARPSRARCSSRPTSPRTLQYMVDEERAARGRGRAAGLAAARDAFYRGDIARAIVEFQQAEGGFLTAEDLAEYRVRHRAAGRRRASAASTSTPAARGARGRCCRRRSTCSTRLRPAAHGPQLADYVHRVTEALKLAFADREAYFGDPRLRQRADRGAAVARVRARSAAR